MMFGACGREVSTSGRILRMPPILTHTHYNFITKQRMRRQGVGRGAQRVGVSGRKDFTPENAEDGESGRPRRSRHGEPGSGRSREKNSPPRQGPGLRPARRQGQEEVAVAVAVARKEKPERPERAQKMGRGHRHGEPPAHAHWEREERGGAFISARPTFVKPHMSRQLAARCKCRWGPPGPRRPCHPRPGGDSRLPGSRRPGAIPPGPGGRG